MGTVAQSGATAGLYAFFGKGGALERAHPGYEYRPGQLTMAREVAEALESGRHLLVEAGTGIGKTLAYLLPVLQSGRRVLISTGTRNLQEQLVSKDVPLLGRALGRDLDVITVKGRGNYACKQKIIDLQQQPALIEFAEVEQYRQIREWARQSELGDQAEADFLPDNAPIWQRLNARRETCTGQKCPSYDVCFLTQLHRRAAAAELVVVNHHLFFADLVLKQQNLAGVLPPYEAVVFDEAHELESVAGQYFGVSLSSHQIEDLTRDSGMLLRLHELGTPLLDRMIERLNKAAQRFWVKLAIKEGRHAWSEREAFRERHQGPYEDFAQGLEGLAAGLDAIAEKPEEIHGLVRRAQEAKRKLAWLMESDDSGIVYWLERRGRGMFLQAAPIDVANLLRDLLFGTGATAILTSATLAVEGNFDYVRERLGLAHAAEAVIPSPYRYDQQALLYVAERLPPPSASEWAPLAAEEIAALLEYSRGRAFVLCTSAAQMRWFHAHLQERLRFPLLLQGEMPRHKLLEKFRDTPHAVLFATSSFWQGVDVQGEQLSCVIIDRLPFAAPGDPLVEARIRSLREQGRNPFQEFQIPEAVLALKQGFGRLIRSSRDRGVLALLDSRVVTKPYGEHFLRSLPELKRALSLDEVQSFFAA